jgi:hypothetical protein
VTWLSSFATADEAVVFVERLLPEGYEPARAGSADDQGVRDEFDRLASTFRDIAAPDPDGD